MEEDRDRKNVGTVVIRQSARILGVIIAAFLLFMFIGETIQSRSPGNPPEPIGQIATIGLTLMGIYVLAILLALKWKRTGLLLGAAALGSFFVMMFLGLLPGNDTGGFSRSGVLNPFLVALWLPILLYLLSWGVERRRR